MSNKEHGAIIGWTQTLVIIASILVGLAVSYATMYERIDAATRKGNDHETRIRTVEKGLLEMSGDLKVIRTIIEQKAKETK